MAVRTQLGRRGDVAAVSGARWSAAHVLSVGVAGAATVASVAGLVFDWAYEDNAYLSAGWRGNDLVTLAVAVPLLLFATVWAARGSVRGRLVWLGALDYMLYNFLFYVFGARLNAFFLAYAAAVALSLLALVLGISATSVRRVASAGTTRRSGVAACLFVLAVGLGAVEVMQLLAAATRGTLPEVVRRTGATTHVVAALDLTLVIPFLVLAAVWLRVRNGWGHVVGVIIATKGVVYMAALCATTWSIHLAGFEGVTSELPVWAAIGLVNAAVAWRLLADAPATGAERSP